LIHDEIPWTFFVLLVGTILSFATHTTETPLVTIGNIDLLAAHASLPIMSFSEFFTLLPAAVIIAFISVMETKLVAKTVDEGSPHFRGQEGVALGWVHTLLSYYGGIPVSGCVTTSRVAKYFGGTSLSVSYAAAVFLVFWGILSGYMLAFAPRASIGSILSFLALQKIIDIWYEKIYFWTEKYLRNNNMSLFMK
jgi:MFS superfamily sulfate permease-like transporter